MNKSCLFVGGPADGEWKTVPTEMQIIKIAHYPGKLSDIDYLKSQIEEHTYRKERMISGFRESIIYYHSSILMTELFEMLINNYRPKSHEKRSKTNSTSKTEEL